MRVLAIDTALNACSVAFNDGDATLALLSEPMQRGHAERLAPMVQEVMDVSGAAYASVDRLVVTTGPGSFTGVRIGLSFARAMALALSKPCVGISTLEALALQSGEEGLRGALIPAPVGAYFALYQGERPLIEPALLDQDAIDRALADYPSAQIAYGGALDVSGLARRGAALEPALYPPKPLYLRAADAKPAPLRVVPA